MEEEDFFKNKPEEKLLAALSCASASENTEY